MKRLLRKIRPDGRRSRPRGATLLIAISAIAILTAVATDLAYNVRVSLQIAANARDELRAYYFAKSAVNMSRLVLHFQHTLDGQAGALAAIPGLGGIHLWEIFPVNSNTAALFLSGDQREAAAKAPAGPSGEQAAGESPFAAESPTLGGGFQAKIENEDSKINVSQLAGLQTTSLPAAHLGRLQQLINDRNYDFLFDREDANGARPSRDDLIIALRDWVNSDETTSALTGNPAAPFEKSFGDKNVYYSRAPEPYKAKNAPFDSLDELYQVTGVSDAFMAAFGDQLTVYPNVNQGISLDLSTPNKIIDVVKNLADPNVPQPALADPAFFTNFRQAMAFAQQMLPGTSLKLQSVVALLQQLGVKVKAACLQAGSTSCPYTDQSPTTFHIRATGTAGKVEKTLDVVVTFYPSKAGNMAADLGRLIHWHEE